MRTRTWALLALLLGLPSMVFAGEVKCPASRDTWISSARGETDCNMGKSSKIKLKVHQGPYFDSCDCSGETACLFLTWAEVKVGQHSAVVNGA